MIEIITVRDPDSSTEVHVFVDGVEIEDYAEESVDPGAGYDREDWDEHTQFIGTNEDYSPAFRAKWVELREEYADSEFIT